VHFYEVLGLFKFYVIDVGAERCFEEGRHNDLRLPSMSVQGPRLLLQLEKLIAGGAMNNSLDRLFAGIIASLVSEIIRASTTSSPAARPMLSSTC